MGSYFAYDDMYCFQLRSYNLNIETGKQRWLSKEGGTYRDTVSEADYESSESSGEACKNFKYWQKADSCGI